jgi:long-chain acyl-CoA synthetase
MADADRPQTRQAALDILTAPGQPYELETRQIGGYGRRVFASAPTSLRELFAQTVSDKTFLVYEDERLTFAQTAAAAARLGHALVHRFGVIKGDRVAISTRNFPEWVIAFQAATSVGAIAVALNALWQADELEYGLKNCQAKVFIADQERLDRLAQCDDAPDIPVIAVRAERFGPKAISWAALMAETGEVALPQVDVQPDDDAIIFYTSGSTGHPKGVISTHRNVISALFSWELDLQAGALVAGLEPVVPEHQPATLMAVPLFHVTGCHAVYLQSYRAQRKLVCMYKWDVAQAAALIEQEKITSVVAPAAMTGDLVREAQRTDRDLSSLVALGGGGAPRAPEQVRQIAAFTKAMPNTGWGMTETNAIGTGIGGEDYLNRPASSGRCSAVLELKVIDDNGLTLPAGERGELLVRGASVFRGYWNRDDLRGTTFEDGWFRTGDVAYLDDEGFLFIVDRIKDLIIRGGENIGCGTVEAAMVLHPGIHEAAVYAVPDERLGEEVGATVFGDPGLDPEEIRAFLGAHLARFEVPKYIHISPEPLPRIASGKILKRQLRDEAAKRLA